MRHRSANRLAPGAAAAYLAPLLIIPNSVHSQPYYYVAVLKGEVSRNVTNETNIGIERGVSADHEGHANHLKAAYSIFCDKVRCRNQPRVVTAALISMTSMSWHIV